MVLTYKLECHIIELSFTIWKLILFYMMEMVNAKEDIYIMQGG